MTDQELNDKIKTAFTHATPDVLSQIRSRCGQQKGTVIPMKQSHSKKSPARRWAVIAAALALVIALGAGAGIYQAGHAVASTVSLDVNPSLEIRVNRSQRVLDVIPLNADAEIVIGGMDFKNSSLDVAVNALIGSMLRNGYLNELANSILVSVDDRDVARGKELETRLAEEIDSLLHTGTFDGSVLSQTIASDSSLDALAQQYGITAGKAQLIQQITTQNTRYTFEELVSLSINELNLISESGSLHLEQVSTTGAASDKSYVGREAAKAAALAQAQLTEEDLLRWECELDFENGQIIYEIELHTADREFDCHVSALTGKVLKCTHEPHHTDIDRHHHNQSASAPPAAPTPSSDPTQTYIGAEAAKSSALAHAGVNPEDARGWECELDRDDGTMLYEVEFKSGRYEYSYEIDAYSGAVLKYEKEYDN